MAKYSTELKEKALALYDLTLNKNKTAKELDVPVSTLTDWIKSREVPEEVFLQNVVKKIDFDNQATDIIEKSMGLMEKRLKTATECEDAIAEIIEDIAKDGDINGNKKKALIAKLDTYQIAKTSELTSLVATLYDKRALAKGEATANTSVTIEINEDLAAWAK